MSAPPESAPPRQVLDPVAAYDRLAPYYSHFSERRFAYLCSVEEQIAKRIPTGFTSLLDIGAGDGSRALRIASGAGISRVVLLEPSGKMLGNVPAKCEVWRSRVEELAPNYTPGRFDVITSLWNVLGHVQGFEKRARALTTATRLLLPKGLLFVDVIHRYNVRSYGIVMTAARWLRDQLAHDESNGDVTAHWQTAAGEISTYGHVFTHGEMQHLAQTTGLQLVERIIIDYETGEIRRSSWAGNLLYVFRRTS